MLDETRRLHDDLLTAIGDLEALVKRPNPDRGSLASRRLALSKASGKRLKFLEERVYPALLESASPTDRERVKKLRADNGALRAVSTEHVARWTIDRAVVDWPDYCRASAVMTASMRERIEAERRLLYPLLSRSSA